MERSTSSALYNKVYFKEQIFSLETVSQPERNQ